MDKAETLALKEIRRSIKDATDRGDQARLDELCHHIDTTIKEASPEMTAALKALPLVRAHYKAESDAELLAAIREIGDDHGYVRACEDDSDPERGEEYVVNTIVDEVYFAENWSTDELRDHIAAVVESTPNRLARIGWWPAYVAGLIEGYGRRRAELMEPELTGWIVDERGVSVRGTFTGNDFEPWAQIVRMAAIEITGIDDEEKANDTLSSVTAARGQFDNGSELFPWSISHLEEVEYGEECEEITSLDLRQAALDADEWPEYYRFENGQALWFESDGRCGVVLNGDAIWTDAKSVEEGIGRVLLGQVIE